jgi:FkbM family methyltransferase
LDINSIINFGRYLAKHRRDPESAKQAMALRAAYNLYENCNYDPYTNGENDVLIKLTRYHFRTILDVGANVGNWAKMASSAHPDSTIHCFEIAPEISEKLIEALKDKGNFVVNRFGLSNRVGSEDIKYYPDSSEHTSNIMDFPLEADYKIVKGEVATGDEYLKRSGLDEVDFLKIDVEGMEYLVLEGFWECFISKKIKVVQFEYGQRNILTKHLLIDFYRFFLKHGYLIGKIYPGYVDFRDYSITDEDFIGPNYLAVRKDLKDYVKVLS